MGFPVLTITRLLNALFTAVLLLHFAHAASAQRARPSPTPSLRMAGSCIVLLDLDEPTGKVVRARILKSTGSQILDDAAIKSFQKTQFKPHTQSPLQVPMRFTLKGDGR